MLSIVAVLCLAAFLAAAAWLLRKPTAPVPGIPFPEALHAPILGCAAQLQDIIVGMRKLCVEPADEHGMSSFSLVGTPIVSVLKAEHVRKVLLASNYRKPIALLHKHLAGIYTLGAGRLPLLAYYYSYSYYDDYYRQTTD
jgi:hypothetical protein